MPARNTSNRRKRANGGTYAPPMDAHGSVTHDGPTEAEISQRAYEMFLSRAGAPGDALGDWLLAELELRTRTGRLATGAQS